MNTACSCLRLCTLSMVCEQISVFVMLGGGTSETGVKGSWTISRGIQCTLVLQVYCLYT